MASQRPVDDTNERVGRLPGAEPPPSAEKQPTRQALLEAAVESFALAGFEGSSIREIERRAGVNRGLVSHYFGTKAQLWRESVDWLMREFHDEMQRHREFLGLVSPRERARILLKVYVLFVSKHPEFFRILIIEGREDSDRLRWLVDTYVRSLEDFFQRVTEQVDDPNPQHTAIRHFTLFGASSMIFAVPAQCEAMFGFDPGDRDFVERFADALAATWMALESAQG